MVAFAAAVPWIASAVGSMLPMIVDSFRSGKSPEEAQKEIAPQRQAMVERLIGSGMNMQQAETMTDEAMADELAKAQLPEPMNPWLTAALAIGGGIGGYKLGAKFAGKGAPAPDVSKEAKIDTPAEQAIAKPASGQAPSVAPDADVYKPGFNSPRNEARMRGSEDRVTPVGDPARIGMQPQMKDAEVLGVRNEGPFPSPPMDPDFSALNMGGQVPGRASRRFTMPDSEVRMLPAPRSEQMDTPAITGEILGTPAAASPFPASLSRSMGRAPMARAGQIDEAFGSRRAIDEQIKRMQMERDWEQQDLLARMGQ